MSLSLSLAPVGLVSPVVVPTGPARAHVVAQQKSSAIVLADKEAEARIMAVVDSEPAKTRGAAMCSQMAAANMRRIRMPEEQGGMNPFGPPGTQPSGLGWDTSTGALAAAPRLCPPVPSMV